MPCFDKANADFEGFHCCEKASAEVATPISAIPADLASAAISINGTPVVITLASSAEPKPGMTAVGSPGTSCAILLIEKKFQRNEKNIIPHIISVIIN